MNNFYITYTGSVKLQLLAAEISWTYNVMIICRCKDNQEREFYIQMSKKFGWSKIILDHQTDNKFYKGL
jgi:predicted nuclease of restriction endonuclease-like (RecB) superfamily